MKDGRFGDLAGPVGDAVWFDAAYPDEKKQELVKQVALGQVRVFADARKLRQVLFNLLSNVVRFTQEGERIAVACKTDADGVTITVSDDGIGIAAGNFARVLEPYVQVRHGSLQNHAGTCLGLTLSERLTEMHGGTLKIESVLREATMLSVALPKACLFQL